VFSYNENLEFNISWRQCWKKSY